MSFRAGKNCKVALGATKIRGMGTVALSGVDTDLLDKTQFGDDWKQWEMGLKDGGEWHEERDDGVADEYSDDDHEE